MQIVAFKSVYRWQYATMFHSLPLGQDFYVLLLPTSTIPTTTRPSTTTTTQSKYVRIHQIRKKKSNSKTNDNIIKLNGTSGKRIIQPVPTAHTRLFFSLPLFLSRFDSIRTKQLLVCAQRMPFIRRFNNTKCSWKNHQIRDSSTSIVNSFAFHPLAKQQLTV